MFQSPKTGKIKHLAFKPKFMIRLINFVNFFMQLQFCKQNITITVKRKRIFSHKSSLGSRFKVWANQLEVGLKLKWKINCTIPQLFWVHTIPLVRGRPHKGRKLFLITRTHEGKGNELKKWKLERKIEIAEKRKETQQTSNQHLER